MSLLRLIALAFVWFAGSAALADPDAPLTEPDALTGAEIVARAHEAAGGESWTRPGSLHLTGHAVFWRGGPELVRYDRYQMWRVFDAGKQDAHAADGRVRIQGDIDGETVFLISFDGETTYDINGPLSEAADSDRWSSNFGFGVIRHALDEDYSVDRLGDDYVDGAPAYSVRVNDPAGGATLFRIRQSDFAVVYVGFDTPRGWHERKYSEFYRVEGVDWLQAGRVRLFYDGVKANEIQWTDFTIGDTYPENLFVVEAR
ncbi:MAG: hypothetical protein AAFX09_03005 [Pseudomonadota bacterium]